MLHWAARQPSTRVSRGPSGRTGALRAAGSRASRLPWTAPCVPAPDEESVTARSEADPVDLGICSHCAVDGVLPVHLSPEMLAEQRDLGSGSGGRPCALLLTPLCSGLDAASPWPHARCAGAAAGKWAIWGGPSCVWLMHLSR